MFCLLILYIKRLYITIFLCDVSLSIFPFSSFPSITGLSIQKNYQGRAEGREPLSSLSPASSQPLPFVTLCNQQSTFLLTQGRCLFLSPGVPVTLFRSVIQLRIWHDISSSCLRQSLRLPCFKRLCEFSDTLWMALQHGRVWLFFTVALVLGVQGRKKPWRSSAILGLPQQRSMFLDYCWQHQLWFL